MEAIKLRKRGTIAAMKKGGGRKTRGYVLVIMNINEDSALSPQLRVFTFKIVYYRAQKFSSQLSAKAPTSSIYLQIIIENY